MTSHTPDDGFQEIQLKGKQLVFLFMAATVVSVVIFLCGVLVGRGVRAERGAPDSAALVDVPIVDQTTATACAAPAGSDPRNAPPPAAVDDLSYFNRLEKPETGLDDLKQSSPKPPASDRSAAFNEATFNEAAFSEAAFSETGLYADTRTGTGNRATCSAAAGGCAARVIACGWRETELRCATRRAQLAQ